MRLPHVAHCGGSFLLLRTFTGFYYPQDGIGPMGVVEQSHETVESYLSVLDESYDSFPVNQTTLTLPTADYKRERERAKDGCVDLYTKVTNDSSEVLHLEEADELVLPSVTTCDVPFEGVASQYVEKETGISVRIDSVEKVTIFGIREAGGDGGAVYRLAIVFAADPQAGTLGRDAVWQSTAEVPEIVAQ